jgi:hypothetical protein
VTWQNCTISFPIHKPAWERNHRPFVPLDLFLVVAWGARSILPYRVFVLPPTPRIFNALWLITVASPSHGRKYPSVIGSLTAASTSAPSRASNHPAPLPTAPPLYLR